jgi:hypothetical protein
MRDSFSMTSRVAAFVLLAVMFVMAAVAVHPAQTKTDGLAVTVSEQVHAPPAVTVETVTLNTIEKFDLSALTPAGVGELKAKVSQSHTGARSGPLIESSAESNHDGSDFRQPAVTLRT